MTSLSYALSERDYLASVKIQYVYLFSRPLFLRIYGVSFFIFIVFSALTYPLDSSITLAFHLTIRAAVFLVLTAVIAGIMYVWSVILAKRYYRDQTMLREPMVVEWSDAGINIQRPSCDVRWKWHDLFDIASDERTILIFCDKHSLNVIPRRVLTEAQSAEILSHKGETRSGARRGGGR